MKQTQITKDNRKKRELTKLLMEEQQVHCLDLDSHIALLSLGLRMSYAGKLVRAKIVAAYPPSRAVNKSLAAWLKYPGANVFNPIQSQLPRIGIHDTSAIAHIRTYLFDLSDYYVECVQAGVIWLAPKKEEA